MAHQVYKAAFDERIKGVDRVRLASSRVSDEAQCVVNMLGQRQKFDLARRISQMCGLDVGLVTVMEVSLWSFSGLLSPQVGGP